MFTLGERVCHIDKMTKEHTYGFVSATTTDIDERNRRQDYFTILWDNGTYDIRYHDWELVQMGVHAVHPINGIQINQVIFDELPNMEKLFKDDCAKGFHNLNKYVGITDSYLFCDHCNYKERT